MASQTGAGKTYGVMAEFKTAKDIYYACEKVRDQGFKRWDACTPFPVHGLDKAMGLKPSLVPWIVLVMGLSGAIGGFSLQAWIHVLEYPLVISGKPYLSWPAFIPVTFELGVLLGSFGAVFGMLGLNQLPRFHHPLFNVKRFERVTDDTFVIAIEAVDPKFDPVATPKFLKDLGATHVEIVEH